MIKYTSNKFDAILSGGLRQSNLPEGYQEVEWQDSGTLPQGKIPARRLADYTLGLYDLQDGSFTPTQFTAGPDITQPTPEHPIDLWCNNGRLKLSPNLFYTTLGTKSDVTLSQRSDGAYVLNGTCTGNNNFTLNVSGIKSGTYILCLFNKVQRENTGTVVQVFTTSLSVDTHIDMSTADTYKVIQITEDTDDFNFRIRIQSNEVYDNYVIKPMLVKGTEVPTKFVPYNTIYADGTKEVIQDADNNQATAENLLAVETYKDIQEIVRGNVTRRVGIKVLDGTEDYTFYIINSYGIANFMFNIPEIDPNYTQSREFPCTHFVRQKTVIAETTTAGILKSTNTVCYIRIESSTADTVNALKAWLAAQYAAGTPVIIVYPLATENTESVEGQTLTTEPVTQISGSISSLPIQIDHIDTPLLARYVPTVNTRYRCNPYGTEEILSSAKSAPPVLDINYGSSVQQNAEFTYRPTKGQLDTSIYPIAAIRSIKGNTIAWNQLLRGCASGVWGSYNVTNVEWLSTVNGVKYTPTAQYGRVASQVNTFIEGHVYYIKAEVTVLSAVPMRIYGGPYLNGVTFNLSVGKNNIAALSTAVQSGNSLLIYQDNRASGWDEITIINPHLFDLTLIYGEGNEPTTVEQFEDDYKQWFGKPLTYEPYNAGELIPVKMTGLKTTGFNQWDEEWELGALMVDPLNPIIGDKITDITCIRSKNYIPIFPNTTYYAKGTTSIRFCFYDANKVFVSTQGASTTTNTTFVTPKNAKYCLWYTRCTPTTYNNDICINLHWSGTKDGTYEPYKSSTQHIAVQSFTGKLNGTGISVEIFPEGMRSAGSVRDEIYFEDGVWKAIKRVSSVDLGSLTWTVTGAGNMFSLISGLRESRNIICAQYPIGSNAVDKSMWVSGERGFYIKDSSYTDATTFKTAMSGVMLFYELATPEVYIIDNFKEVQKVYRGTDLVFQKQA